MAKKKDGCGQVAIGLLVLFLLFSLSKSCSSRTAPKASSHSPGLHQVTQPTPRAIDGTPIENPESYVPKTVTLVKPIEMPLWRDKKYLGQQTFPVGSVVNLRAVIERDVLVENEGRIVKVPAASTDLLDQMVRAAGD